ncbi:MAG: bifunctional pyr operon transcriptional regulator/uracil phosphoribosyltransferase PyrR [Myxococcota bacterium]
MNPVSLSNSSQKATILDQAQLRQALSDLVDRIYILYGEASQFDVIGIERGGAVLAEHVVALFDERYGQRPQYGRLDITLYRDDLYTGLEKVSMGETKVPFTIDDRVIVLIDDVLFTGRTVRAALQELLDLGRPSRVHLSVLIDRGHRELPIHADDVSFRIDTQVEDRIQLVLSNPMQETDGVFLFSTHFNRAQFTVDGEQK